MADSILGRDFWMGGPPPNQGYAQLDPHSQEIGQLISNRSQLTPEQIAGQNTAGSGEAASLLQQPGESTSRDLRLGMGGTDAFNRAIQERSAKVFSGDINRLKSHALKEAFGEASDNSAEASHSLSTENAMQMGAFQRHYEYDMARRTMRQNAINSALGMAGQIAGFAIGGPAGTAAGKASSGGGGSGPVNGGGAGPIGAPAMNPGV